jgi:DNA-binding SARP family transcriptional activator/DNA-binding beta-propeller fold protein YncE
MEFRILGPLEVFDDGRPVSIRRGKEQALLAYLLLHANEVVPSGRLIDALWDERPPPTASKILQNAVSHLRKELGDGRLLTRDPGYVLRVEKDELDVQRFEQLAKEGRGAEALALWRGTPLLDLKDERFADDARRRLEEQRLAVLEDRIDDDLAAGKHAELVPELELLVGEHPLRDRLQGQLMRALYGAGRQADALEAYRQARRTLSQELGLEPGPQLQELERKILTQDPALAPVPLTRRAPRPKSAQPSRRLALLGLAGAVLLAGAAFGLAHAFGGSSTPIVATRNSLAVIDPGRNRVVKVLPVGDTPRGVAAGSDFAWVANSADGTVSQIDINKLRVIRTIGIGAQATDIAEANGQAWVATGIDNSLVPIDARSGGVHEAIHLTRDPSASAFAVTVGAGALWVASGDQLLKIDLATGALDRAGGTDPCCHGIHDVAFGEGAVWLADVSENLFRVSRRGNRVTGSTELGVIPAAVTTAYGAVWLALPDPSRRLAALGRVDPQTLRVTQTVTLGKGKAYAIALDIASGAGSLWITNFAAGTIERVDPKTLPVVATIDIGNHPSAVTFGAGRVWVTVS